MMSNRQALLLLEQYAEALHAAIEATAYAKAMLTHGGEAIWDSVKDVAGSAATVHHLSDRVVLLREHYEEIVP